MHAILSAIGPDRPGIVDEVSSFVFERGGNIEDSRMVNLRGQFAVVMLLSGDEAAIAEVKADLPRLGASSGLHVELRPAAHATARAASADAMPYRFTATAIDQTGLLHRLSHVLRELGVNIESLDTRLVAAPYTGAPLFEIDGVVSVPRATPLAKLRERLASVCDELNVDWKLEAM